MRKDSMTVEDWQQRELDHEDEIDSKDKLIDEQKAEIRALNINLGKVERRLAEAYHKWGSDFEDLVKKVDREWAFE